MLNLQALPHITSVMSVSGSVDLPACISGAPTGWISIKFDTGNLHENLSRENPKLFKMGQKCGAFFIRHKHVLFLPVTINCHKSYLRWKLYQAFSTYVCLSNHLSEGISAVPNDCISTKILMWKIFEKPSRYPKFS